MRSEVVRGPAGRIEVRTSGEGPTIVMIASLGRAAGDFDELGTLVASHGYRVVAPQPRGIGETEGFGDDVSLRHLAGDIAAVVHHYGEPAYVLGHAFGNRVARMTASLHPTMVRGVILLGCGGAVLPDPADGQALLDVFDPSLDARRHIAAVRRAFFAPGNDPTSWSEGWYSDVARMQGASLSEVSRDEWWHSGHADVLVVQAADDVIAPPANGERLMADLGSRGELVIVEQAGHAMLPEQPARLAEAITAWLSRR